MFDPEQITFFAKTDARGVQVPFGIKAKDRTKHVYVIGKTGMGKSTLLENMAVQDIKNGNGLAFIDPHGATAETLLNYIPEERLDDLLYFAPFDTAHPISFNVMEDVGPDKRHLVVSGLMSVFKKIWVDAWSARMEYILSNTLLALLEYPDSTLLGVNRMLSDKHYRKKVVDNIKDPAVKSFWVDEFANYNERYMQEAGDAIKNKIGQFTSNPLIRNIVGQPHSSFDLREVMDGRKILIANLSKGLVGESNANLLGSMLTTRIYLAAMSRADMSAEQLKHTPNFYFYVDEFQSFANATFADILSEARKYKLNLTIAHQYIEQMEEEVRNAVFGNVGTIIAFRVGPFDAEVLETIFTPKFLAADIVNLGFAQIYLTLMIDGIGSQPFSALTLPPIAPEARSFKDVAIARSRERYAGTRAAVEAAINAWHAESHADIAETRSGNHKASGNNSGGNSASNSGRARGAGDGTKKKPPRREFTPEGEAEGRQKRSREDERPAVRAVAAIAPATVEPVTPEKPQTNEERLEALRSILRNISKDTDEPPAKAASTSPAPKPTESKPAVDRQKKDRQAPAPNKDTPKNGEGKLDLKAALAVAVGMSVDDYTKRAQTVTDSTPAAPLVPPPAEEAERTTVAPSAMMIDDTPPSESAPVAPTAPVFRQPDPLAPKKLERMMRVTGNDKNPLR